MTYGVPELGRRRVTDRHLSFGIYVVIFVIVIALLIIMGVALGFAFWARGMLWRNYDISPRFPFFMVGMAGWGIVVSIIAIILSIVFWWYQWQLYKRRNDHIERVKQLKISLSRWLKEKHSINIAPGAGSDFYLAIREQYRGIGFFIAWVILSYFTGFVGFIFTLIAWYWLTRDYAVHEQGELEFFRRVSQKLKDKGISFEPEIRRPLIQRSMVLYIVLMIIPGVNVIWSIWWSYVIFNDPNIHFDTHGYWESQLKRIVAKSVSPTTPQPGLDILKERYARGEITREEFEKMKKDISSG